jgi:multisubunit Na+/H+ antiporter MnhE subunit
MLSLHPTLSLATACLALVFVFGALGARPVRPLAGPRLIPWRFLMLAAFAVLVALLVHAANLVRGEPR